MVATATLVAASALSLMACQVDDAAAKNYAELLSSHVKNGRVSYKAIEKNDQAKLDAYLKSVAEAKLPSDRNAKIGMYIDAYNAFVIQGIIKAGHPKKVIDIKDFFDKKAYTIAGKTVSLNELEKKILNPYAKDPRTHFVLVCAAVGCPILEAKPYAKSNTNKRMAKATRRYLGSKAGAVVSDGAVQLSMIFKWYEADFGGKDGVIKFVKKWLPKEKAKQLGDNPKISYIEYDWNSNKQ